MAKKKTNKEEVKSKVVKLEKLNDTSKKNNNIYVGEGFFYLIGFVLSLVLVFATSEFLFTINYLFVVIFAIVAVIELINFIMDKEYLKRNYSGLVVSIMSIWMAFFVFKYGDFLFLEMLPVLVSLLLFIMATSSFTKYFDYKITGNLIVSIVSIILGLLLIFVPRSVVYILFKITGIYMFLILILDFIDLKKKQGIEKNTTKEEKE